MCLFGSTDEGEITDEERSYLAQKAAGIGLYILGASIVSQEGLGIKN